VLYEIGLEFAETDDSVQRSYNYDIRESIVKTTAILSLAHAGH